MQNAFSFIHDRDLQKDLKRFLYVYKQQAGQLIANINSIKSLTGNFQILNPFHTHHRNKRSYLLPFIGQASHFLFASVEEMAEAVSHNEILLT